MHILAEPAGGRVSRDGDVSDFLPCCLPHSARGRESKLFCFDVDVRVTIGVELRGRSVLCCFGKVCPSDGFGSTESKLSLDFTSRSRFLISRLRQTQNDVGEVLSGRGVLQTLAHPFGRNPGSFNAMSTRLDELTPKLWAWIGHGQTPWAVE